MSEYVTVVSVDLQPPKIALVKEHERKPPPPPPSSFVTVLSINNSGQNNTMTINTAALRASDKSLSGGGEIVTVYRLPGERLGFGLKFQGGTKTNERVDRLFIQSCDAESPASKARASWGPLGEGDEILEIDREPITKMTRIECVKCLKDRNVAINLLVKKGDRNSMSVVRNDSFNGTNKRPLPPSPPRVPPRKILNKKPPPINLPPKVIETPVAAENYLNSLDDDSISLNLNDESDETGSTISSQISVISNFSSESDLSLLSAAANAMNNSSSDLTRILTKPFQMIEREFNVNNGGSTIDNLILFNEKNVEKIEQINYASFMNENAQYENIDVKKTPPTPRPRGSILSSSISSSSSSSQSMLLPQEKSRSGSSCCEIDSTSKTPTKTIESWLNDAKAINRSTNSGGSGGGNDKNAICDVQSYEPIKFEYFAAADDEEEKLGPSSELLKYGNISEAYFNFPWCANASNNLQLPTIGEAEEEFSSMENFNGQQQQRVTINTGPIFIFHDDSSINEKSNGMDSKQQQNHQQQQICHGQNMEINNNNKNNSPYLHGSKDKSDDIFIESDEKMIKKQCESRTINSMDARGSQCDSNEITFEKSRVDSNKDIIIMEVTNDICEKSHNETVTTPPIGIKQIHESAINIEAVIRSDSEQIETMENTTIIEAKGESTVQTSEIKTEKTSTTTTSQSTVHNTFSTRSSEEKMDHQREKQLFSSEYKNFKREEDVDDDDDDKASMRPDEKEISVNRLTTIKSSTIKTTMVNNNKSEITIDLNASKITPLSTTTKATAIVAPQRKAHTFEEITNFTDTKPPFKSATLGRRTTSNWRNNDEKSEKSVKDKIAMFSNSTSDISHIMPKSTTVKDKSMSNGSMRNTAKSIENIFNADFNTRSTMSSIKGDRGTNKKKAMSMENLDDYTDDDIDSTVEEIKSYTPVSRPMTLQSRPPLLNLNRAQSVEYLMSPPILPLRPPPPTTAPIYSLERRISFNGYTNSPQTEEHRQKSIANIIESRKKNLSKLRGLVIPDKVPENEVQANQKLYFDLPVIRSKECALIKNISPTPTSIVARKTYSDFEYVRPAPRTMLKKEFMTTSAPSSIFDDEKIKTTPPVKPPRTSLIFGKSATTATDESDSESCSRISTPPISPVAKKPLIRTLSSNSSLSSNSTLTSGSGSQASCSSNGSKSPEARKNGTEVNTSRKSIVASAKSRSGRDCLEKSWRDEDSTDGGIDNDDDKQRVPKVKSRNSITNYKLVTANDNVVDKVINVATYVEVMSSDSEEKNETSSSSSTQKTVVNEEILSPSMKNDMSKWVRSEVTKKSDGAKKLDDAEITRTIPKSMVSPKKLNLSEIRRNFENKQAPPPLPITSPKTLSKEKISHNRYSSWDSIASSSSGVSSELLGTGTGTHNSESLQTNQSDFGSFSSFGSSHSLITPQDLQLIIDEADPPLETAEAFVVVLHRENPESSIGITLAGGSDYEAKEITIHRILANSPADKDGRLKKGDRLLSINGLSMRGLTHRESLSVLKSPRTDVVMVVTRAKSAVKPSSLIKTKLGSLGSLIEKVDGADERKSLHASRSIEMDLDSMSKDIPLRSNQDNDLVNIIKDGTGIGLALDGGFDSPAGNFPLLIKKVFMGGAAEKMTSLKAGDEIIEINGLSTARQTRIDVWNMIKKLPQGDTIQLRMKRK